MFGGYAQMDLFGEEGAMFIRNLWYVAAWEHEMPADGLFSRVVSDGGLVVAQGANIEIHDAIYLGEQALAT
jgi:hypothetical protein